MLNLKTPNFGQIWTKFVWNLELKFKYLTQFLVPFAEEHINIYYNSQERCFYQQSLNEA